jgi:CDP-diacylglycerol--serine O-phosphatidyltransferase
VPREADASSPRPRSLPPHFSLLRSFTLADFITLVNAVSGVSSVFACIEYALSGERHYLWIAIALVPIAALADFMDGRVARRSRRSSKLGGDLDSLADLISFGVAPAALAYVVGMSGGWDWAVLVYFVCCGLSRLARYNVTGTPIPTSLVLVMGIAALAATGRVHERLPFGVFHAGGAFHPLVLAYFLSGSAMVSARLRVPKP